MHIAEEEGNWGKEVREEKSNILKRKKREGKIMEGKKNGRNIEAEKGDEKEQ